MVFNVYVAPYTSLEAIMFFIGLEFRFTSTFVSGSVRCHGAEMMLIVLK